MKLKVHRNPAIAIQPLAALAVLPLRGGNAGAVQGRQYGQLDPLPGRGCRARGRCGLWIIAAQLPWTVALAMAPVLSLVLLMTLPGIGAAQERLLYRALHADVASTEPQLLAPEETVELGDTPLLVRGATELRVVSPDPEIRVMLRFRDSPGEPEGLTLTVIVDALQMPHDYLYRTHSQVIEAGKLKPRKRFRMDEDVVTALDGEAGRTVRIVVQDDGAAELRVTLKGTELLLEAIPAEFGGRLPYRLDDPVFFHDYHLLGSGFTDNGYGEFWVFEKFGGRGALFISGDQTQILVQGLLRAQLTRWEQFSIWVEGGGAFHTLDAPNVALEDENVITFAGGGSLHWRMDQWGALAHVSLIGEDKLFLLLEGGWHFFDFMGFVVTYQSFGDFSGFGAGLSYEF